MAGMKRVLFVDHAFHRKTRSSDFFVAELERALDVEILYLEPGPLQGLDALQSSAPIDAVVLWQLDYLAPLFLAQGYPTIVVPMFDGSGSLPDEHWLASRDAHFINFSLTLHARLRSLGCRSFLARYFPAPAAPPQRPVFSSLRAFLWRRRPDEGFDVGLVETLFGARLLSLHVHDAPDPPAASWRGRVAASAQFAIERSDWFADRVDYLAALGRANVFVAPREAEGIGHGFLEAMARGMMVVAHNRPTHSEYIADGVNGLLFDVRHPHPLAFESAADLGRCAWQTVEDGRGKWEASIPLMLQFIKDSPAPDRAKGTKVLAKAVELSHAFYADRRVYADMLRALP